MEAVYPVFVVAPYTQLTLVRGVGVEWIIKYLTVIQELHAVYPVFVVAPYMLLTLVRGVGGRIIKYLTVTYTRVACSLPRICCCTLYAADPGTRCGW